MKAHPVRNRGAALRPCEISGTDLGMAGRQTRHCPTGAHLGSGHFQMEPGRSGIFKKITRNFQCSRLLGIIGVLFTEKAHHKRGTGLNIPFTQHNTAVDTGVDIPGKSL